MFRSEKSADLTASWSPELALGAMSTGTGGGGGPGGGGGGGAPPHKGGARLGLLPTAEMSTP